MQLEPDWKREPESVPKLDRKDCKTCKHCVPFEDVPQNMRGVFNFSCPVHGNSWCTCGNAGTKPDYQNEKYPNFCLAHRKPLRLDSKQFTRWGDVLCEYENQTPHPEAGSPTEEGMMS